MIYANPRGGRAELARGAELARAANDDWALVTAKQLIAFTHLNQSDHAQAAGANDEVAALAERLGDPFQVARRWLWPAQMAALDGRYAEARDAVECVRAAVDTIGEPLMEGFADMLAGLVDVWQGDAALALERLQGQLERPLRFGAGIVVPWLLYAIALAELATGRFEQARGRLEALVPLVEGRDDFTTSWTLSLLAEAQRLLTDGAAEATALKAQAIGEKLGNRLVASRARWTLGRRAAAGGDWTAARQHALAQLDACVEGGHATYVPGCLDALGEVAAGLGADEDSVRLLAAADRGRADIGAVRVPPEKKHWAEIDKRLREALGEEGYRAARAQGAELTTDDALEWARRARGPRQRPPGGWESLTPTELKVAELVAQGLTNPQVAERMFVSPGTVKTHVAHIFGKLEIHSRAELTAEAVRRQATT
jgi:DNA-binding CsgD family transcriptional regulator